MTTSATHGACYGIGPTIQTGPDASDDSCELLSQTIGGSTGLVVLAQGKGILKLVGSKFAQPAQGASKLKNERSDRNKREHVLYKKLTIVDDFCATMANKPSTTTSAESMARMMLCATEMALLEPAEA